MSAHVESVVSRTNADLMAQAAKLYIPSGARVLDVTYGNGGFWKKYKPKKLRKHDRKLDGVDFRSLPELPNSVDVLVFDPPYVIRGGQATQESLQAMVRRYDMDNVESRTLQTLKLHFAAGVRQAQRVLRPNGILMVKCQDFISSGKYISGYNLVCGLAEELDFFLEDVFILHRGPTAQPEFNLDGSKRRQVHSRRTHSYLMVFRKRPTTNLLTYNEEILQARIDRDYGERRERLIDSRMPGLDSLMYDLRITLRSHADHQDILETLERYANRLWHERISEFASASPRRIRPDLERMFPSLAGNEIGRIQRKIQSALAAAVTR